MIKRGAMIVIEGADRVGKTTFASVIAEKLNSSGIPVKLLKFPDRTTAIGKLIDSYLKSETTVDDHVIHLLFSANRWEWFERMKQEMESGTSLLIDRYAFSGVAYSAAKANMSLTWCKQPDVGLISPDLVLYLTASSETLAARPGFGGEIYESTDFQTKVKQNYEYLKDGKWKEFCTESSSSDVMIEKLLEVVTDTINTSSQKPLDFLWREATNGIHQSN